MIVLPFLQTISSFGISGIAGSLSSLPNLDKKDCNLDDWQAVNKKAMDIKPKAARQSLLLA